MVVLNGIKNFLQFLNDNWTIIVVILGLIIGIVQKVKRFIGKSKEEKIAIAKKQIEQTVLKLVSDAEWEYELFDKAGKIKRSQVIETIFAEYPILSKITNQDELIEWIDTIIDDALETIREVFSDKTKDTTSV